MRIRLITGCCVLACVVAGAHGEEPVSFTPDSAPPPNCFALEPSALRFEAEADYLLYWLKPVCLKPATLSFGDPTQPGARIVQGDHKFEFGGASGIRPRLRAWLNDSRSLGVEAEGFVLEQVSAAQSVDTTNGSPATFIVFQAPDNTPSGLPFTIPGQVTGSSSAVGSTQLWGLETNLACRLATAPADWQGSATLLAGVRYLHLDDRVVVTNRQALVSDPSVEAVGQARFATCNQFVGAQVGSRFGVARGPLALDLTAKVAFGEAHLESRVAGGPLLAGQSVQPPLVPGPFLALPSNVGRQASWRVAVVPEVNVRLRWLLSEQLHLTLGYNLLYWNKVLCPGDQMDSHVNPTQLPFRGPIVGPRVPARQFVFTDAFAHGLEAGLGFRF